VDKFEDKKTAFSFLLFEKILIKFIDTFEKISLSKQKQNNRDDAVNSKRREGIFLNVGKKKFYPNNRHNKRSNKAGQKQMGLGKRETFIIFCQI